MIFKREGEQKQKTFTPKISGIKGTIIRGILTLGCLPYKSYISAKAIIVTLYRVHFSHMHLLEWTTSEEAEKQAKSGLISYYNQMAINVLSGLISIGLGSLKENIWAVFLGVFWIFIPICMWYISKDEKKKNKVEELNNEEKQYAKEVGKRTWKFFETYLTETNNFLIPDNYQEDRKEKIVLRTSSTNIGLSLLAVISAYDLGYIEEEKAFYLLKNIIFTIQSLPKWNGHLYNWYQIQTKEPLIPRYVSTVDSGNLIGYLFVVKTFLEENIKDSNRDEIQTLIEIIDNTIKVLIFQYYIVKNNKFFQ
ncbi:MAG: hypothetical protein V8R82_11075 [Clostridia bacterium]